MKPFLHSTGHPWISICLHEVWILDGSYVADSDEFNMNKDVAYTVVDSTEGEVSRSDIDADLAGWYRSSSWKAVSGVSHAWNIDFTDIEISGNETAYQYMNGGNLHNHERMVGHGTAMNSTCDVPAPDRCVPDLRAMSSCQTCNMLNNSHGVQEIASTRGTVGVNELMVWHGMFCC